MKNFIICILILFLSTYFESKSEMELKPNSIKMQQNSSLLTKNNQIIQYGLNVTNDLRFIYTINYFNGESWEQIPNEFKENENKKIDTFRFSKDQNNIAFDELNNIWIAGQSNGYYKWNGINLEKFRINDEFANQRLYESIAIDSNNNIWLTTKVILNNSMPFKSYFSELYKFDGNSYSLILKEEMITSLGFSKIFVSSDNRVKIIRISFDDNILSINEDDEINYSTLNTPHYIIDSTKYEKRFPRVHRIIENNKDLWFCLGRNDPTDPGVVIWKNELSWDALDEDNNYRQIYSLKGIGTKDSLFAEANGMAIDEAGKIWLGGAGFLNYLNNENILVKPNVEQFLSNSTFYSRDIITDFGIDAPEEQINFLRSTDSLITVIKEIFDRDFETTHLLGKSGVNGVTVDDIAYSEDGSLWISFSQLGVLRYQPNKTYVDDFSMTQEIYLFPQPLTSTNAFLNIGFAKTEMISKVSIYNMNGKLIQRSNYEAQFYDKIELKLDNNDLIAGIYIVAIEFIDRTIFRKIIIN